MIRIKKSVWDQNENKELDIGIGYWILELNIGYWNWILEVGIGYWNWILELDIGIEYCYWILELEIRTKNVSSLVQLVLPKYDHCAKKERERIFNVLSNCLYKGW